MRLVFRSVRLLAVLALATCVNPFLTRPAGADTLNLKDGRTFHGRVVASDDKMVAFEMKDSAISFRMKVARSDIQSLQCDTVYLAASLRASAGPFRAADLEQAFQDARQNGVGYVVLTVNVDPVAVEETAKAVALIGRTKDLQVIALVHRASGASAAIALACKTIVMTDNAVFRDTYDATPELAALLKTAAEQGGHSAALAQALADRDVPMSRSTAGQKEELVAGTPAGSTLLRESGAAFSLSAKEAVVMGIARGIASDITRVGSVLGSAAWRDYSDSGTVSSEMAPPARKAQPVVSESPARARAESPTSGQTAANAEGNNRSSPQVYTSKSTSNRGPYGSSPGLNAAEEAQINRIKKEAEIRNKLESLGEQRAKKDRELQDRMN